MSQRETHDQELSFARDLPLTQAAISFASERHGAQRRDGDGAEFLVHPVEVASMLKLSGYDDEIVAAGVLHDVLEDTDVEALDVEARFGARVSELVALVSDDPAISDEEQRRDELRERISHGGDDALAVYAADKVSKVRELRMLMAAGLDEHTVESKHRHYRKCLDMLERRSRDQRLLELLRFELEALENLPPRARPADPR